MPSDPFILLTLGGHGLEEYPSSVIGLKRARIAFAGGGYFRLFPYHVISACIKWLNRKEYPVVSYLHPRDFDPDTPRLPMPWKRRFKCYVNLSSTYGKLDKILSTHAFTSIRDWRGGRKSSLFRLSLKNIYQ